MQATEQIVSKYKEKQCERKITKRKTEVNQLLMFPSLLEEIVWLLITKGTTKQWHFSLAGGICGMLYPIKPTILSGHEE